MLVDQHEQEMLEDALHEAEERLEELNADLTSLGEVKLHLEYNYNAQLEKVEDLTSRIAMGAKLW
jgi:hypothetical protein